MRAAGVSVRAAAGVARAAELSAGVGAGRERAGGLRRGARGGAGVPGQRGLVGDVVGHGPRDVARVAQARDRGGDAGAAPQGQQAGASFERDRIDGAGGVDDRGAGGGGAGVAVADDDDPGDVGGGWRRGRGECVGRGAGCGWDCGPARGTARAGGGVSGLRGQRGGRREGEGEGRAEEAELAGPTSPARSAGVPARLGGRAGCWTWSS